jgi:hypothetical protein
LALRAKKGASLGLDDPFDRPGSAGATGLTFAGVDKMKVLKTTFAVDRISISPIAER